jgi:hypothetical protein
MDRTGYRNIWQSNDRAPYAISNSYIHRCMVVGSAVSATEHGRSISLDVDAGPQPERRPAWHQAQKKMHGPSPKDAHHGTHRKSTQRRAWAPSALVYILIYSYCSIYKLIN